MNVTTINNNVSKAQANVRYPNANKIKYSTECKSYLNYGLGLQQYLDIPPSQAINQLIDSKCTLDCERLALTVTYKNALDKLGAVEFNRRVRSIRVSTTIPFRQVPERLQAILEPIRVSEADLNVGDWVYLSNPPRYRQLCLAKYGYVGAYNGEHLVVSGTNPTVYRGHINVVSDGKSLDEWKKFLHDGIPSKYLVNVNEIGLARDENGLIIARRIKD